MKATGHRAALFAVGAMVALGAWPAAADAQEKQEMAHEDAFAQMDENADERLDRAEFETVAADVDKIFIAWDEDADEYLDRGEIERGLYRLWDRNKDGVVSEQEFKDHSEATFTAGVEIETFADWDKDGDSELDADEVSEALDRTNWNELMTEGAIVKADFSRAWFRIWDRDGDGFLERQEWDLAYDNVLSGDIT